jgi:integrase
VTAFLSSLAVRGASASTQNQALSAIPFLFEVVLGRRLAWMNEIVRAQRPARLPVVLSRDEVSSLLSQLRGSVGLMASLLYGSGLRLLECVELRVKDINFDRGELTVRDGKGGKDRVTMLPGALKGPLLDHLERVKAQHEADMAAGRGSVALPGALRAKYANAPFEWTWQWVFPATRFYVDQATGERRWYHLPAYPRHRVLPIPPTSFPPIRPQLPLGEALVSTLNRNRWGATLPPPLKYWATKLNRILVELNR